MQTKLRISFEAGQTPENLEAILHRAECDAEVVKVTTGIHLFDPTTNEMYPGLFVDVTLDEKDVRIAKLYQLLATYEIKATTEKLYEYSEEDRQNARLLRMIPAVRFPVAKGRARREKFDLKHACPHCGTGAKQVWFTRVKPKGLSIIHMQPAMLSTDNELVVDANLRKMLVDANTTGISFIEVQARDDNEDWQPIDRYQIVIEHMMPPIRAEFPAEDEKAVCHVCRRGCRLTFPEKPYREDDLVGMKDFNLTWEGFGTYLYNGDAADSDFSQPHILVTPKVMNLFRDADAITFKWIPVTIAASSST